MISKLKPINVLDQARPVTPGGGMSPTFLRSKKKKWKRGKKKEFQSKNF